MIRGCMLITSLFFFANGFVAANALGESAVLNIATSEYPPYEYWADGKVVGTHTQMVRAVVERMDFEPKFHLLPWARAEAGTRSGTYDLLYSLTKTKQRAEHYYFTDPISEAEDVFFKLSPRSLEWETLNDLAGFRFGLSASYSYAPSFMDWLGTGKGRVTSISHEKPELTGLRMVALGRVDLFICEKTVCEYIIDTNVSEFPELSRVDSIERSVGPARGFRVAISRKHPRAEELRDRFNEVLAEIKAESEL